MRRGGKRAKRAEKSAPAAPPAAPQDDTATDAADAANAQISYSNLSLHELFEQQARSMLENADIDEEQKQSILVAMACPCCGAGGMSFSVKLRNRSPDGAQRNPGRPSQPPKR